MIIFNRVRKTSLAKKKRIEIGVMKILKVGLVF